MTRTTQFINLCHDIFGQRFINWEWGRNKDGTWISIQVEGYISDQYKESLMGKLPVGVNLEILSSGQHYDFHEVTVNTN